MSRGLTGHDYHIGVETDPRRLDARAWNALLDSQPAPTPFLRLEYLAALHASASAVPDTGWGAQFLTVHRGAELVAAAPLYVKSHSYGEYVFDWAWADAYRRHGLAYYPKLLGAVPFTPVPGTRLLACDDAGRDLLVAAMRQLALDAGLSSAHVLFVDDTDRAAFERAGWMLRENLQFHWTQDRERPVADFDELLARLQREKRKKIQQERRRVAELGVEFTAHEGEAIDAGLWDFFHRCYTLTYAAHHSTPYLTRDFFARMQSTMAQNWLLFVGRREGRPVAASLIAIDRERGSAWGRYWGCVEPLPFVHFEACYYQPLAWCLREGFLRFEGGAQGEHKMARGLLPVRTSSAHWLRDERFAGAVAEFLAREGEGVEAWADELRERSPFKRDAATG
ncbi:GNAT family N-acetyltransferase [Rubrivivax gelatinosus]|uniref:GNAT family N-acetyltransferase n=1 Tax=Rubrivivax gelatinosus TaxID=28068 RepID=A0ABS1DSQ2_RUBGE|nr:GNAT family N-acetyltransferase [Rubrivivax gelatinosus]MBK1712005.1 GNAT family N-acetyltransferase [Rubrivivax gelatinosus]